MVWDWVWIGREIEPQQKICFNPRQAKSFLAAAARSAAAAALCCSLWRYGGQLLNFLFFSCQIYL